MTTEKMSIDECEIRKTDDGSLGYRRRCEGGCGGSFLLFRAFTDPDCIGFKFADGTILAYPVMYRFDGNRSDEINGIEIEDVEVLDATHVCFRRQK